MTMNNEVNYHTYSFTMLVTILSTLLLYYMWHRAMIQVPQEGPEYVEYESMIQGGNIYSNELLN